MYKNTNKGKKSIENSSPLFQKIRFQSVKSLVAVCWEISVGGLHRFDFGPQQLMVDPTQDGHGVRLVNKITFGQT